jgi:hypothetical protein
MGIRRTRFWRSATTFVTLRWPTLWSWPVVSPVTGSTS